MAWLLLGIAILFEIVGTTGMKVSDGFSRVWPSIGLFASYAVAFTSMTFALKQIDLSTAYAIWSGVGTAATAVIGFVVFQEAVTFLKVFWIAVIIVGVAGLKFQS